MGSILKEVRVRGNGQDRDIKVTIEKSGLLNKKRKVYGTFWGSNVAEYKKEDWLYDWDEMEFVIDELTEENEFGKYQKYYGAYIKERYNPYNYYQRNGLDFSPEWNSDLDIIRLYILINTENLIDRVKQWSLIEDPIKGEKGAPGPYYRSFGFDSYYLNNGARINIKWLENTLSKGGISWSDEKGNELPSQDLARYNTRYLKREPKGFIEKVVDGIVAPDGAIGPGMFEYNSKSSPVFSANHTGSDKYASTVDDMSILGQIISHWKQAVPGYESLDILKNAYGTPAVDLLDSNGKRIEYKNPLGITASEPTGTTASDASGMSASNSGAAAGMSASGTFKPTIKGIEDGFQIPVKTDLPNFSIFVGDPEKDWPKAGAGDVPEDGESFENVEGAEVLDEEYEEAEYEGAGEGIITFEDVQYEQSVAAATDFSPAAVESGSTVGGSNTATSNSDGTVSNLLASSPVTTADAAGKYASSMVMPSFNNVPIYSQGYDPRWNKKPYDKGGKCGDSSTVGSSGCGPTSLSMLINYWAARGLSKFTSPHDMAALFERTGCRVCGAGSSISGKKLIQEIKNVFGLTLEHGVGVDKIERYVKKGIPCVISGKNYKGNNILGNPTDAHYGGGHFVCLTGFDSQGRIRVNDPGRAANSATAKNPSKGAITHFPANKSLSSCVNVNQTVLCYHPSIQGTIS